MRPASAVLLALVLLSPLSAGAAAPAGDEATEAIGWHTRFHFPTQAHCSSSDPLLGIVSLALTSTVRHVLEGDRTRYVVHLDATVGDAACPAMDLAFESDAAWPARANSYASGRFWMECGAAGYVDTGRSDGQTFFQMYFGAIPEACGDAVPSDSVVAFSVQDPHPQATLACVPVVVPSCVGVGESGHDYGGCSGESLRVVAVIDLASGTHGCDWREDGEEYASVGDGLGLVRVRATDDGCAVLVGEGVFGAPFATTGCPQQVGDAIFGMDWHDILP